MPDELWTEVRDIIQETGIKTIPKKKKCKKAKWLSEEDLQIAVKRREGKAMESVMGIFQRICHYLHYLYDILASGQKNRKRIQPCPSMENWIKDLLS